MKRPLSKSQCVLVSVLWCALCIFVLTHAVRIDGMLIVSILMSGIIVAIPVYRSLKK